MQEVNLVKHRQLQPGDVCSSLHPLGMSNQYKGVQRIMVNVKKVAIFVGGMLFGSAGFKILASKDAKKVYTQTTAAVLRMKDCTMETVSRVQEEAGDILADAKAINEARAAAAEQEVIADDAAESAAE